MRRFCSTLILISALAISCHRGSNAALVGKWTSVNRGQENLATAVEFHPNGTLTSSFETVIESKYAVSDGKIKLSGSDPRTGEKVEDSLDYHIDGDKLV